MKNSCTSTISLIKLPNKKIITVQFSLFDRVHDVAQYSMNETGSFWKKSVDLLSISIYILYSKIFSELSFEVGKVGSELKEVVGLQTLGR